MRREYNSDQSISDYLRSKGYQTCEWIESDGNQFLSTNVMLEYGDVIEGDLLIYKRNRAQYFFGAFEDYTLAEGKFYFVAEVTALPNTPYVACLNIGNGGNDTVVGRGEFNNRHTYKAKLLRNNLETYMDGSFIINYTWAYSIAPHRRCYVFASNDSETVGYAYAKTAARVWSLGVKDKLQLYPIYNIVTGKGAMWDSVSDTILTNQGTGAFTHGPNIEI